MGSNSFGTLFRITTWGESHGKGIGVVIDGCPAGLALSEEDINKELKRRAPGQSPYTSPRKEKDVAQIYSGVFEGKTTGTPISLIIHNQDVDSTPYAPIKDLMRPGHANFTYLGKYGIFDHRGGGRASGRETACRVAAGAVAKKLLSHFGILLVAYIREVGGICIEKIDPYQLKTLKTKIYESPIFCPDPQGSKKIIEALLQAKADKDSLGGIIECCVLSMPIGLGDPVYEKLEANLAKGMMTIPGVQGFEIGAGFRGASMKGSEHNDLFITNSQGKIETKTNNAGGTLGGISTGMPLLFRIVCKPTSSIGQEQKTVDTKGKAQNFHLSPKARTDPCIAIRAVPVVEATAALAIADALVLLRSSKL